MPNHNTHSGLAGKRVLVTRPAEQAEEFITSLTNSGAEAVLFPTIRIIPAADRSDCDKALENFDNWNALVFTSANGVRFFVEHTQTEFPQLMANLQKRTVYAVGEKTAAKAAAYGLSAIHFDETQNAEQLADELSQRVKGNILFPCGSRTGDTMKKTLELAGVAVKPVVVYQTLAFRPNNTESVVSELKKERIDAVTFFSPSSIKHFLDLVPQPLLKRCAVAVIGSTTADAARTYGLHPDIIAQKSDSQDLIKTLENYYLG
jgi:uroporphyrinogen-III synthase